MSAIVLDFEINEAELAENLEEESNPRYAASDLIVLTYFIMPVRMQINGKELFAFTKINDTDPWIGMPIANIAVEGLYAIRQIPTLGKADFDLPEGAGIIQFTLIDNNKVKVVYKKNNIDEIVSYTDLLQAFLDFNDKVKKFLNERVPQMREHPFWGAWVRGEEE